MQSYWPHRIPIAYFCCCYHKCSRKFLPRLDSIPSIDCFCREWAISSSAIRETKVKRKLNTFPAHSFGCECYLQYHIAKTGCLVGRDNHRKWPLHFFHLSARPSTSSNLSHAHLCAKTTQRIDSTADFDDFPHMDKLRLLRGSRDSMCHNRGEDAKHSELFPMRNLVVPLVDIFSANQRRSLRWTIWTVCTSIARESLSVLSGRRHRYWHTFLDHACTDNAYIRPSTLPPHVCSSTNRNRDREIIWLNRFSIKISS